MLFDFDRVLRGGGYLWLDHFFSKWVDFNRVYKPLFGKLEYKIMDKTMDLSEYNKKDIITSPTHTSFASRLKSTLEKHRVLQRFLLVLSLIGACMVIGDGVLTPAISVFSAVSGLELSMSKENHKFFYASVFETSEIIPEDNCTIRPKAGRSGKAWEKASEELIKSWRERGFSSLIVSAPELSPWTLVQKLLPLRSISILFDENLSQNVRVTWECCSVLLDINDGDRLVFARLSPAAILKMGKENCSLKPLTGAPFGSVFRVENGKNGSYSSRIAQTERGTDVGEKEDGVIGEELRDNREIVNNNAAQVLSREDIDSLRREGASGDQIVKALIANSATFDQKTAYSQEKYRLRKQRKYVPSLLLRRPFARRFSCSICEAYFKKHPTKIGFSDRLHEKGQATSTNSIASIFSWKRGLKHRLVDGRSESKRRNKMKQLQLVINS